jgi:hypothetical protein
MVREEEVPAFEVRGVDGAADAEDDPDDVLVDLPCDAAWSEFDVVGPTIPPRPGTKLATEPTSPEARFHAAPRYPVSPAPTPV